MRTLLATATAVLLLGGLAACSDEDPTPKFEASTESPNPTDPPTTAPTPEPPTSTSPAEPETAEAFVRRWQAEAYAMQLDGYTSEYLSLTLRCKSCQALAQRVDELYKAGGSVQTQPVPITSFKQVGESGRVVVFEYELEAQPSKVIESVGAKPQRFDGGLERYQVNIVPNASSWRVIRVSTLVD